MRETREAVEATCEVVMAWNVPVPGDALLCGKVATHHYPAMGGGYMHLCLDHGKPHLEYAEPCYAGPSRPPVTERQDDGR